MTSKNVRDEGLDKFYTIPSYSKECIDKVFSIYDKKNLILLLNLVLVTVVF